MEELRVKLQISEDEIWEGFSPESEAGELCEQVHRRLKPSASGKNVAASLKIPTSLGGNYSGSLSTQQIFGRILTSLARELPELAKRVVTCSPDGASATKLGGWINKLEVGNRMEKEGGPKESGQGGRTGKEATTGQHIER